MGNVTECKLVARPRTTSPKRRVEQLEQIIGALHTNARRPQRPSSRTLDASVRRKVEQLENVIGALHSIAKTPEQVKPCGNDRFDEERTRSHRSSETSDSKLMFSDDRGSIASIEEERI